MSLETHYSFTFTKRCLQCLQGKRVVTASLLTTHMFMFSGVYNIRWSHDKSIPNIIPDGPRFDICSQQDTPNWTELSCTGYNRYARFETSGITYHPDSPTQHGHHWSHLARCRGCSLWRYTSKEALHKTLKRFTTRSFEAAYLGKLA